MLADVNKDILEQLLLFLNEIITKDKIDGNKQIYRDKCTSIAHHTSKIIHIPAATFIIYVL